MKNGSGLTQKKRRHFTKGERGGEKHSVPSRTARFRKREPARGKEGITA